MKSPAYSYAPGLLVRVARDLLLLRSRDFHSDARSCIEYLQTPLQVLGKEHIPLHGPCVITVNHYHRPGFRAQWLAMAISALVPAHVHWVITSEHTQPATWYGRLIALGSRILLKRIAHIYDFTTMPPMPPRPQDVEARARSVRAVLNYVMQTQDPILGMAPEGYDPPEPSGALTRPAPGLGRFGLLLAKAGLIFVPVGIYEAGGVFHVHFGEPYELRIEGTLSVSEKDERAAHLIMQRIASLLPSRLRGEYA